MIEGDKQTPSAAAEMSMPGMELAPVAHHTRPLASPVASAAHTGPGLALRCCSRRLVAIVAVAVRPNEKVPVRS